MTISYLVLSLYLLRIQKSQHFKGLCFNLKFYCCKTVGILKIYLRMWAYMSQDPVAFSNSSSIGVARVKNGGYSSSKL